MMVAVRLARASPLARRAAVAEVGRDWGRREGGHDLLLPGRGAVLVVARVWACTDRRRSGGRPGQPKCETLDKPWTTRCPALDRGGSRRRVPAARVGPWHAASTWPPSRDSPASPRSRSGCSSSCPGGSSRVAVFRPVVRARRRRRRARLRARPARLARRGRRCRTTSASGVTYDDVHADPDGRARPHRRPLPPGRRAGDAVVVVGSDYTDVGAPTEFSFNARIAANLGAPVLLVLNGHGQRRPTSCAPRRPTGAGRARGANHGDAVRRRRQPRRPEAGRPDGDGAAPRGLDVPAFAMPEEPLLSAPSVADLMAACDGTPGQRRRGAARAGGRPASWSRR